MQSCMAESKSEVLLGHWDEVRVLLAVLRAGTFSKAAKRLGLEQSTVSRRIQSLEQLLGYDLFERGGRAPVPTDAAQQLRPAAERVETELSRFADAATTLHDGSATGTVTLALTEELAVHLVVPKVLPRLRVTHPEISLKLVTSYDAADLMSHEADIALRFFQTPRGDLVGRRIATLQVAVLAARGYAKRMRDRSLEDLDWVNVELPGVRTAEAAWLEELGPRNPSLTVNSYQVQLAAIRAGLGVGLGPALYATLDSQVVVMSTNQRLPSLQLYLLTRRAIRKVKRIAIVMEALERVCAGLE